jgi:hypothetical protein
MNARKNIVVVGHGMVGHRFVQEMRARDLAGTHNVVVLCEEPVPAYDRVGLSSYVGAWDPRRWRCRQRLRRRRSGGSAPGEAATVIDCGKGSHHLDR